MKFHRWFGSVSDGPRDRFQGDLGGSVEGHEVHLVERQVHDASEVAFDHHVAADQLAHQVAHGRVLAQRHQRAEVAVNKGLQGPALQPVAQLLQQGDAC